MITKHLYGPASLRWLPLLLALLLVVLAASGAGVRDALAFDRTALQGGQAWRLLSAHFVHLGVYHTALNVSALGVFVLLCPQAVALRFWLRRLLLLSLAISLGLYFFVPALQHYVGFSGVLHGLFVLGLLPQAWRGDRIAALALLYLSGKLLYESLAGAPLSDAHAIGGAVITEAHRYGALAALLYAAVFGADSKNTTSPRTIR